MTWSVVKLNQNNYCHSPAVSHHMLQLEMQHFFYQTGWTEGDYACSCPCSVSDDNVSQYTIYCKPRLKHLNNLCDFRLSVMKVDNHERNMVKSLVVNLKQQSWCACETHPYFVLTGNKLAQSFKSPDPSSPWNFKHTFVDPQKLILMILEILL